MSGFKEFCEGFDLLSDGNLAQIVLFRRNMRTKRVMVD